MDNYEFQADSTDNNSNKVSSASNNRSADVSILTLKPSNEPEPSKLEDFFMSLGGFSWFQIWATIVLILPEIPASMIVTAPVFTGTSKVEFACSSVQAGLNSNYTQTHVTYSGVDSMFCASNCSRVPYSTPYRSIVQEWDLVCGRDWITGVCHSAHMAGTMTGALVASVLSDKYGRKKSTCIMIIFMGLFGVCSGLAPELYSYTLATFLAGIGVGGYYVSYNIYVIEFLTPSWRTLCGCLSIWFSGEVLLALLSYLIPSWRLLTIATSAPAILAVLLFTLVPDSPRWLLCKGRLTEATQALNQIAKWNGKPPLGSHTVRNLMESICKEEKESDSNTTFIVGVAKVLKNSELRWKLLLFSYSWCSLSLVYYGITFNIKNLSGDAHMNLIYLGLLDLVGFPFGAIFNNWLGRKKTFAFFIVFGAIWLISLVVTAYLVGLTAYPALITTFCLLGKFCVTAAWGVLICFATESFPTVVRSTCLGLCALLANIGSVLAPQMAFIGTISPVLPYYIFCGLTVVAAALSWFLGETNKKALQNFVV